MIYKKIKKKSALVVGDSLLNGIEESKLSKDRHIRVQPISGAKIKDISNNLDELIQNYLKTIILHVGTNNAVEDAPEDIYNDLISLKAKIEDKIPSCQVVISCLIRRSDNVKANKTAEKVNSFIKLAKLNFIDNVNITDKHLGRRGLHLNHNGNIIFAKNLLNASKSWCQSNDLVFNIYENSFIKATKNVVDKEYETKIFDKQIRGDDKDNLSNIESDVSGLVKLRKDYINNPSIGYLNINSRSEEIISLREICLKTSIDILCVDEMKLDSSYPNAQFHIDGYQFPPFRKDRHKYGGGKMVYTRDGIIAKRLENLEGKHSETICLELTVSKKKWCITFAYRPPSNDNKAIFFNELTTSLSQITNLYD